MLNAHNLAKSLVIAAMQDSRYDWRTIESIAQATGLSCLTVEDALSDIAVTSGNIERFMGPDRQARRLYALRDKVRHPGSFWERVRQFGSRKS